MAAKVGMVVSTTQLDGWIPIRIYSQNGDLMVDWCYLGALRLEEPFFGQTIHALIENPFHSLFRHQTPIAVLEERYGSHPGMKPAGFIFHMTHCGSTLIAQTLASAGNLVIAEADPLEMLLRRSLVVPRFAEDQLVQWLRWMVSALGQRRTATEKYYFIKFDAFPITQMPVLERAFPDVPWIFVYRNPIEVLASTHATPSWAIRGYLDPSLLGLEYAALANVSEDEYLVRLLALYCECALRWHGNGRGKLVNFLELPGAIWTSVASHFGAEFSNAEITQMRNRAAFNAKRPREKFTGDREDKHSGAAFRWRRLAANWLDPLYDRLEAARVRAGGKIILDASDAIKRSAPI